MKAPTNFSIVFDSRFNVDTYLSFLVPVSIYEAINDRLPLNDEGPYKEIETNTTVAISFEEGHEETKANEHHYVDVLEHCYQI